MYNTLFIIVLLLLILNIIRRTLNGTLVQRVFPCVIIMSSKSPRGQQSSSTHLKREREGGGEGEREREEE